MLISTATILFFSSLLWPSVVNASDWQETNFILKSFYEIALKNEHDSDAGKVRKWTSALNIWVETITGDKALNERITKAHLAHLAAITDLELHYVNDKRLANLQVIFTNYNNLKEFDSLDIERLPKTTLCLANITTDRRDVIKKALVVIPVDEAMSRGKFISCVVEELTQILGLVNDSERVYPSIFNDSSSNQLLTGLDYILLKLLYHPNIKAGMNKATLAPLLTGIIREMRNNNEIAEANYLVKQSEMYQLLDIQ